MSNHTSTVKPTESPEIAPSEPANIVRRHLALGWGGLLLFILLGIVLEGFHAFKVPSYLDADSETRRFLWRLAHAHGALLSVLQFGASWTFTWLAEKKSDAPFRLVSRCLTLSLVLLPAGFFLAGFTSVDGDPGLGIVLVPAGAIFLIGATVLLFRATVSTR